MDDGRTRVVLVSGLSGSGRSTAMAALEDLGFYAVDNLPPPLIEQFLALCGQTAPPIRNIALRVDTGESAFLAGLPAVVEKLRAGGVRVDVLFLDSSDETLVNRYRETRRVHPLAHSGTVEEGIRRERRALEELAKLADSLLDTTRLNVHQLREAVVQIVTGAGRPTVVNLTSFGYRFGVPQSTELLFDVRFLPNPHFEPRLRERSGEDPDVAAYVLEHARSRALLERLCELLDFLLPFYDAEGKPYLAIGVGCTGGRHRSIAVVNALARELRARGRDVNVVHRDVEKGS
jgi:UPF0042 nucleotide-binding protein